MGRCYCYHKRSHRITTYLSVPPLTNGYDYLTHPYVTFRKGPTHKQTGMGSRSSISQDSHSAMLSFTDWKLIEHPVDETSVASLHPEHPTDDYQNKTHRQTAHGQPGKRQRSVYPPVEALSAPITG
jgi:hypothetical protein